VYGSVPSMMDLQTRLVTYANARESLPRMPTRPGIGLAVNNSSLPACVFVLVPFEPHTSSYMKLVIGL
jgi:hypothetical protein